MREKLWYGARMIIENWRSIFLAFVWVLFMFFFTYTTLFEELLKTNGHFSQLFYDEQSRYLALYVNIGLVFMLLFDNHSVNKWFRGAFYYIPFIGLVIALLLMGHCNLVKSGEHINYRYPLSEERLSYLIYIAFLIMLFIMKVRTLMPSADEIVIVKKEL